MALGSNTHGLSDVERRFVEAYLSNGRNGAKAWRKANNQPHEKRASEKAGEWLKRDNIRAAMARADERALERTDDMIERYALTEERVLFELASLAFSQPLDLMRVLEDGSAVVDLSSLTPRQAAAIAEVTVHEYAEGRGEGGRPVRRVRVKLVDKLRALTLLITKLEAWIKAREGGAETASGNAGLSTLLEEARRLTAEHRSASQEGEALHGDSPGR